MTYIKKIVIKGFKSFARETTIEMDKHMNVVVGPNGSGKSNITDAMCFVLGRLSIKSIRAAKASHLIFSGNKNYKGGNQAQVGIVLDNSDKTFALDNAEINIKRIVKKNGQSVYKINNETKTRQEVIELLSQAGIDPNGFNIILQGEIEKFVKMPAEERRKVIEEVAGISVYEMRKEKSIKELTKTDERLRQVNMILRERTNYLRNLEKEREQALRYKKLEKTIKRCKASIINKNILEKTKISKNILSKIDSKNKEIKKIDEQINKLNNEINSLNERAENISKSIQKSSGLEQDNLNNEISIIKQEIAGMIARKENFENQLAEMSRRGSALEQSITTSETEISELRKQKPLNKKKDLEEKKARLEQLDDLKRKYYLLKSNFSTFNNQIIDRKKHIQTLKNESNFIINQIEKIEKEIKIKQGLEEHNKRLNQLKDFIENNNKKILEIEDSIIKNEKELSIQQQITKESEKIKLEVSKLDICPLCKTQITKGHIQEVINKSNLDISKAKEKTEFLGKKIKENKKDLESSKQSVSIQNSEVNTIQIDIIKLQNIDDKKQQLKRNKSQINILELEFKEFEDKKKSVENKISTTKLSEEQYENLKLEVNELQRSEERNLGFEITAKQREIERIKVALKQIKRDKEDALEELKEINESLEEKQEDVEKKEEQAEYLKKKYQKMFEEKNSLQDKVRLFETNLINKQNEKRLFENDVNNLRIEKAQINAQIDSLNEELSEFGKFEFLNLPVDTLKQKLNHAEDIFVGIGNVNMKALEFYDGIKEEYDKINEKVNQLESEKQEILNIISKIDRKKKKTFLQTLNQINDLFSRNFSQLSVKGVVTLEPQDKKEIFNGGLNVIVKVGAGKYFDITSLSGGEQTLVALSLIFAIQELRPYCFYIFDEIDAALDRRNSEKLAYLLKKHMRQGQYLIITHNDSIISESSNILYGVSMQDGISKILSIEI